MSEAQQLKTVGSALAKWAKVLALLLAGGVGSQSLIPDLVPVQQAVMETRLAVLGEKVDALSVLVSELRAEVRNCGP